MHNVNFFSGPGQRLPNRVNPGLYLPAVFGVPAANLGGSLTLHHNRVHANGWPPRLRHPRGELDKNTGNVAQVRPYPPGRCEPGQDATPAGGFTIGITAPPTLGYSTIL